MNDREAEKHVKKDNVWKKPDYEAMIEGGKPPEVAFYIKTVRDSIAAKPRYIDNSPEGHLKSQKQYIDTVRELQGICEGVNTKADVMTAFESFVLDKGYAEHGSGVSRSFAWTEKGKNNDVITNKLIGALHINSEYKYRQLMLKAEKQQFGVPKEEKIPKGYEIHLNNDGRNIWSKNDDWKPGTWYVTRGSIIQEVNFPTKKAALKWVQENAVQTKKSGRKRYIPDQLKHIRRDGPDYRSGREIIGVDYLKTFGFRGGEFGNWVNQNERQESLNMGFDALKDLAAALCILDKDIALDGNLAIAFGARGSGKAVAHYEPLRKVIRVY